MGLIVGHSYKNNEWVSFACGLRNVKNYKNQPV